MRHSNFPPTSGIMKSLAGPIPISIEDTQLADAARQILENEVFQHIYEDMRYKILEEFWQTPSTAPARLADLSAQAGALQKVHERLQAYVDNMKLERVKRAKQDTGSS